MVDDAAVRLLSRRILMVSPVATHPVDAGNRARIVALVRELRTLGNDVHFALMPMEGFDLPAMQAFFGADHTHLLPWTPPPVVRNPLRRAIRHVGRAMKIDRAYAWGLDDWVDPAILPTLRALDTRWRFDVVFVEYVFLSKAFEAFGADCLKVLDTHDRFGFRHRTYLAAGQQPKWFSTTDAEEARGFARADVVVAIQPEEERVFRAQLGATANTRVTTVGHLLDTANIVTASRSESVVIFGSSNPINVEGARYFIEHVAPRVRERVAGFQVKLAGDVGRGVPDSPGVVKLGRVAQVTDAFGAGAIAVNPVRTGTGLNIKLMEALAAGVPNVSTRSGIRGLDASAEDAVVVVPDDDPERFADAVVALLRDPDAAQALATRGHRFAVEWNARQMQALSALLLGDASIHATAQA